MGHTLLATTPESLVERLPLKHDESGCVITADVRLDNRAELLDALNLANQGSVAGDAALILAAYLQWDTACVERLLGDFAFAIWDPRQLKLFCARDHFGMRPYYYHHVAGRLFVFASEPRAILVLPQTRYRINEGRIADFLVQELEGVDKTSTFFNDVYRLPPAHTLTVGPQGFSQRRYWSLEPGPELRLKSDDAYAEAFLGVFTEAVRCRLRGAVPVGSMLSGGMDSGSIVAVAREVQAASNRGPLSTFSATAPDPGSCVETRTINTAIGMGGLDPHKVDHGRLDVIMPELDQLGWNLDEPFDSHMTLQRALYIMARRNGVNTLMDGAAGDVVLSHGSYLARLMRRGRWRTVCRESVWRRRFRGEALHLWRELYWSGRAAFAPGAARAVRRRLSPSRRLQRRLRRGDNHSIISDAFARRVSIQERLRALDSQRSTGLLPDFFTESAEAVDHAYMTVGRERYERVAASAGVEARDPFMDKRVVAFCVSLPGDQKLRDGWTKAVLRRSMAGRLPEEVRWRIGKEHLGWAFTLAFMESERDHLKSVIDEHEVVLSPYVDLARLRASCRSYFDGRDQRAAESVYTAVHLIAWLRRYAERPQAQVDVVF
jgi:asparagine synthase (glutamine-hydrolysing)